MSGRTYLSIGDVLTLLRQEFPDVTISKIRFLESQGLVNPERTPSGYRKFYDHDVERLRWVLRQQREHFLPLKVIKDRLDDDLTGPEPTVGPSGGRSEVEAPGPAVTAHRVEAERPLATPVPPRWWRPGPPPGPVAMSGWPTGPRIRCWWVIGCRWDPERR